jgi:hypothetical protein
MKLAEVWSQYLDYTNETTAQARHVAYALAGVCWFFKRPDATFPPFVVASLAALVCFFATDILQQFSAAIIRRFWLRHHEKRLWDTTGQLTAQEDVPVPVWIDYPAFTFFLLKLLFLGLGTILLLAEFFGRIF